MKTQYKSKRGTIGRSIEELVNKCKMNPMQFYVLAQALAEACEMPSAMVTLNGKLYSQTEGYKKSQAELDKILADINKRVDNITKTKI